MTTNATCQLALKEWAITVRALADGDQIMMLRKGGISEDSKDFRVVHPEFLLLSNLPAPAGRPAEGSHQPTLRQLLSDNPADDDAVTFTHWARVHELLEIDQLGKVEEPRSPSHLDRRLRPVPPALEAHVPLTIMLLRVYRMEAPVTVAFIPEYGGCKSWVDVIPTVNLGQLTPVVDDATFAHMVEAVRGSLGLVTA